MNRSGGKDITAAVQNMGMKIGIVTRAAGEVQAGSGLIVRAIDRIRQIEKSNAGLAAQLQAAMDMTVTQSETLNREIEKFRT